ncbi:protein FAR1-RELATED SEQUENCE 6-like [Beta vulgaris subsp. vulgaris]|uniref:protein FAR1-RELATED SEQUENCE 6-like n=1 Tax=Beta vulgaris subsp. vulgaris TaxID=3555 RepID=UPI00054019C8|nr:protein FAR1-RELATED SEQUENCE 6-like [Beta vulgaris subsp. vulgaris]
MVFEGLFREREIWVPAYLRHMFWAGMKTTQRVESINSFFHGYVNKHTRLFEFAERYCEAMEIHANDDEKDRDGISTRYVRQLITDFVVEHVFQKVYTDAKFKELQRECTRTNYLIFHGKNVLSGNVVEHIVEDRVWIRCRETKKEIPSRRKRNYKVIFDCMSKDVSCSCKMFECQGIMCRHMIMAYEHDQVDVPEKYILRRWRKDVQRKHTRVKVAYHDPSKTDEVRRYDMLFDLFVPICEKADVYEDLVGVVTEALQLLDIRVDENVAMIRNGVNGEVEKGKKSSPPTVEKGKKRRMDLETHEVDPLEKMNVIDPPNRNAAHRTRSVRYYTAAEESRKKKACGEKASKKKAVTKKKENGSVGLDETSCCAGGKPRQNMRLSIRL